MKPLALITGAASGIGAEVAQRFAARGYDILVVERTSELAESGAAALGDAGIAVECDLSDRAQVANLCDRVAGEWSDRLELVIANAGIGVPGDVADISAELLQNHVEINLVSVMTLAQAAVQTFVPRGRGHFLATVSLGGIAPMPGTAAYAASKAGLRAFLASLNAEVHKTGVSVGGIYPSAVDTPMLVSAHDKTGRTPDEVFASNIAGIPEGRIPSPDEIAKSMLYLASDASSHVTGVALPIDGGYVAG